MIISNKKIEADAIPVPGKRDSREKVYSGKIGVMHVSPVTWPIRGGLSTVVHQLTAAGQQVGDNALLIRPVGSISEENVSDERILLCSPQFNRGLSVIEKLRYCVLNFRAQHKLNKLINNEKINIVHIHYPVTGLKLFTKLKIPYVVTLHGSDLLQLQDKNLRNEILPILENAKMIFPVSEFLKAELLKQVAGVAHKVTCIKNGRPKHLQTVAEKQIAKANKEIRILFVGDLLPVKGVDILARVFLKIHEQIKCSLTMLGEGNQRSWLEEFIQRNGLEQFVCLKGEVSPEQVFREMLDSDILVLPSRREGLPNVLLEAMASGCAVLGSDAGGVPEIIRDGQNGLMFKAEDEIDFYNQLKKIVTSQVLRQSLVKNGYAFIETYPDWEKVYLQYRSNYQSIIK